MSTVDTRNLGSDLSRQVVAGATAAQIATAVKSAWRAIERALWPILGKAGVAALLQRSVLLASKLYPWLPSDAAAPTEIEQLFDVLSRQPADVAADVGGSILQAFNDLLTILVGNSLTERLLGSVWDTLSSGMTAQDLKK